MEHSQNGMHTACNNYVRTTYRKVGEPHKDDFEGNNSVRNIIDDSACIRLENGTNDSIC